MNQVFLKSRLAAAVCFIALFPAERVGYAATAPVGSPPARAADNAKQEPRKADIPLKAEPPATHPAEAAKTAKENAAGGSVVFKKTKAVKNIGDKSPDQSGEEESPKEENFLHWLYRSMGLQYTIVFLAITFNEIALLVMIVLGLRQKCICPMDLADDFEEQLNQKQYREAFDTVKDHDSLLAKVLTAGMANLSEGYESMVEAMQETGREHTVHLEQRNGNIALIAQIGPMLGLLATVDGIVRSFAVIASREVTPKPSELANGIGIALVNTMVGLFIAITSIIIYHYARNRLTRLVIQTGIVSGHLMKRFEKIKVRLPEDHS